MGTPKLEQCYSWGCHMCCVDCAPSSSKEQHSHHSLWNDTLVAGWHTTPWPYKATQATLWVSFVLLIVANVVSLPNTPVIIFCLSSSSHFSWRLSNGIHLPLCYLGLFGVMSLTPENIPKTCMHIPTVFEDYWLNFLCYRFFYSFWMSRSSPIYDFCASKRIAFCLCVLVWGDCIIYCPVRDTLWYTLYGHCNARAQRTDMIL